MDPLEALRDGGPDAEKLRALSGPVARAAGAVFLTGDDQERHVRRLVLDRRVVDRHLLAVRLVDRDAALFPRHHQVADADVREGAPRHHAVVPAPRSVAVEVLGRDTALLQVETRGTGLLDCPGRTDVVRGHRVSKDRE